MLGEPGGGCALGDQMKMTKLLQDIHREPEELAKSLSHYFGGGRVALRNASELLRLAGHIHITGIGTSWHAGMAVLSFFNTHGRPAILWDASELLHFSSVPSNSVVIILSRSGKSVEIVRLLCKLRSANARIIAVTNTPESPLGQQADACLVLQVDFDHLVSVTMYSGLTLVGSLLASMALEGLPDSVMEELRNSLTAAQQALPVWQEQIKASDWSEHAAPVYFLARGGSLSSCHEARLLWEEAAKAPAAALPTGSFRHGPQEVIRPGSRVGLWVDGLKMRSEDLRLSQDLRRHGAKVLLIG